MLSIIRVRAEGVEKTCEKSVKKDISVLNLSHPHEFKKYSQFARVRVTFVDDRLLLPIAWGLQSQAGTKNALKRTGDVGRTQFNAL